MNKHSFILSDESENSRGFSVLTDGIDLSLFLNNPIMLYRHNRENLIGRWENIRKEGKQLIADAVFDTNDELGSKISQKVEDGFLRAASIGLLPLEWDATKTIVTQSRIYEASIVELPSNGNAVKLYNDADIVRLSFDSDDTDSFLNQVLAVLKLPAKTDPKKAIEVLKKFIDNQDAEKNKKGSEVIEQALKAGKISAQMKPRFENMLKLDFEGTIAILEEMKGKQNLSSQIINTDIDNKDLDKSKWKLNDYRKYAPLELRDNPNLYQRLVAEFNQENKNN